MTPKNELFDRHWAIYQSVLTHNAMFHREFASVARGIFEEFSRTGQFDMLDLGCGDAGHVFGALAGMSLKGYTGYDLSNAALDIAHDRLAPAIPALHLLAGPMEELIQHEHGRFDIVYSGYAVHHLSDPGKEELFRRIHGLLKPEGVFVLVDVFRLEDQDRKAYLDDMADRIQRTWNFLDQAQKELILDHLRGFDHPATRTDVTNWGEASGFQVDWAPAVDHHHHAAVMRKMAV